MLRNSAVPLLVCGGAPGAIQAVTFRFHLPTIFAICWCSGPGVAAFMYLSIIACSSGLIFLASVFASSARAANEISTSAAAIFMWVSPLWARSLHILDSPSSGRYQPRLSVAAAEGGLATAFWFF